MWEAFPSENYENWPICQILFPHAKAVLAYQPTGREYIVYWTIVLYHAGWYALRRENYSMTEEMNQQALKGREKALGKEHVYTLESVNMLASVPEKQGR